MYLEGHEFGSELRSTVQVVIDEKPRDIAGFLKTLSILRSNKHALLERTRDISNLSCNLFINDLGSNILRKVHKLDPKTFVLLCSSAIEINVLHTNTFLAREKRVLSSEYNCIRYSSSPVCTCTQYIVQVLVPGD